MDWDAWSTWERWEHIGKVAPAATAFIALIAACVAVWTLRAQVSIARKRAAIDFFLKTEMDKEMLKAFSEYKNGLKSAMTFGKIDDFQSNKLTEYDAVQNYLNTIELICIGINQKVFDQRVCYGFWMDVLKGASTEGMPVIEHVRAGDQKTYEHLLRSLAEVEWSQLGMAMGMATGLAIQFGLKLRINPLDLRIEVLRDVPVCSIFAASSMIPFDDSVAFGEELCGRVGDGVNQVADLIRRQLRFRP